jgi:hypothetical protein
VRLKCSQPKARTALHISTHTAPAEQKGNGHSDCRKEKENVARFSNSNSSEGWKLVVLFLTGQRWVARHQHSTVQLHYRSPCSDALRDALAETGISQIQLLLLTLMAERWENMLECGSCGQLMIILCYVVTDKRLNPPVAAPSVEHLLISFISFGAAESRALDNSFKWKPVSHAADVLLIAVGRAAFQQVLVENTIIPKLRSMTNFAEDHTCFLSFT